MTWAELIREYYKLCMKSNCALNLSLNTSEPGAHYICIEAHEKESRCKTIIGYVGLATGGIEGRMVSYDNYKDPDDVIEYKIEKAINLVRGEYNE